ncbi:MAG: arginase family protein [Alphaproteobacteria bacterium]
MAGDGTPALGALFGSAEVESFLGIDRCDDLDQLDRPIALIGAPTATPYRAVGAYCSDGPTAIRQGMAAFAANLAHHDFDLGGPIFPDGAVSAVDGGDLPCDETDAAGNRKTIQDAVSTILAKGAVPIVLGGDDSVPIPVLEAFAGRGRLTILQIDAHIDWRDVVDGERYGLSSTMRRASEMDHVEAIVQVGQRGIGSARSEDVADAKAWGAALISAADVHRHGIEAVAKLLPDGADVILSIDCDSLDPSVMPAVIGRAPGGLWYGQALDLLTAVAARCRIAGLCLVEFMPARDVDGIGALTAGRLVASAMGLIARQVKG